ncbi:MAG: asparagine synthase-related protein [Gemmatimonadales bacterium]|nr:asparagine synthase-related protein [Gemmatimonadales bacterium]
MSGIVGVFNLDARPAEDALLARMSAALRHRGPDGEGRRVAGPAGFAWQHLWVTPEETGEVQPPVGRSGAMLVMDGRLDNRDELLGALRLPPTVSDAACVLAAYEAWGERFPGRLNGDFALAVFDERQRRLLLVRDPIGVRPLYYFRSDRLGAFASEIKALLAHPEIPARPDDEGLADYLLLASRPVDRQDITCFTGISAVVPAHLVVVTPERLMARRYWDFDRGRTLRLNSFGEYAEAFRERFAEAVRRRTRAVHPVAVSVSGGLDSSSIFCQAETLRRAGRAAAPGVIGISYVGAEGTAADEQRFLREIEQAYGVSVGRIPIEPLLGVVRGAEDQVRAIEAPFMDYFWGVTREVHVRAREAGARVLLSGHWGDQMLFSAAYLADLFRRLDFGQIQRHTRTYQRFFGPEETLVLRRRLVLDVARHYVPRAAAPLFKWLRRMISRPERPRPWFSDSFRRRALRFANRPVWFGDGFHSVHARSLYLEARSKYHVHCMEWNNKIAALHGLDAAFPFLDRDLIAFLMAAPGEIQNRDGVPRALLREAMGGILPEPLRARTWKADFTAAANSGIGRDLGQVCARLSQGSLAARLGYLDERRLAAALPGLAAELEGPDCLGTWDLTDLFALEVWLEVFLGGERAIPARPPTPLSESTV